MNEADRADVAARPAPEEHEASRGRRSRESLRARTIRYRALLAFAFFGAAVAWAVHLMVSQLVSEWSYFAGEHRHTFLDVSIVVWILAGVTLVLLGIGGGSLLVARNLRRERQDVPTAPPSAATVRFATAVGLLSGIVFLLVILAQALPLLFFPDGT
ncbi:MAG TPA: hypothetical protein VGN57_01620 [Pirellulaceae bacterium]|jgi:hypothetical protein|nr:hypothetical protein [Pirellulaceae bacterium]